MICKNCGKELKEGTKFCDECGAAIDLPKEDEVVLDESNLIDSDESITAFAPSFDEDEEIISTDVYNSLQASSENEDEKRKSNRNTFVRVISIAIISIVIIFAVVLVKNFLASSSPDGMVKNVMQATYNFDINEYCKFSTINKDCQELLGNTDYNYESEYASMSSDFEELKGIIGETFGSYNIDVEVTNSEVYEKGSEKFKEYLNEYDWLYKTDENIEAFAKVDADVNVSYTYEGEELIETEQSSVDCILLGDSWYVIE